MRLTFIIIVYILLIGRKNMYICLCNNLTSKKVQEALKKGVNDYKNVHSFYNCQPKCGKCLEFISDIFNESTSSKDASNY